MTNKLSGEIIEVLGEVGQILTNERPTTHGDISDFASVFTNLHTAYLNGVAAAGRPLTPLDAYAVQVIQKLARIANGAPEHSGEHFIDVAGYAVAATAHVRKAREAAAKAEAAHKAQFDADARQGRDMATSAPIGGNSGVGDGGAKLGDRVKVYVIPWDREGHELPPLQPGTEVWAERRNEGGNRRVGRIGPDGELQHAWEDAAGEDGIRDDGGPRARFD